MTKCEGIGPKGEVAVEAVAVEVSEKMTKGKEEAAEEEVKKRKLKGELMSCSSLSPVQLKRRRGSVVMAENSGNSSDPCSSPFSDRAFASCCSSNASSELAKEQLGTTDLQEFELEEEASSLEIAASETHNIHRRERRETTPSSEIQAETVELESNTTPPSETDSRRRSTEVKMPSEAELEEFFSAAEIDIQNKFSQKYNFDVVKDEPLEGRYEWTRVKP